MFKHYLKIAYRNLLKYKMQSVICMLGLAVGLACFTICNYMLRTDLAWNIRLPHLHETYILVAIEEDGRVQSLVHADLAERLKAEFPEIEKSVVYLGSSDATDKMCVVDREEGGQTYSKEIFYQVDQSFFDFYDFQLTSGNWDKLKNQPNALILTQEGAGRIFQETGAVGKTFTEVDDFRKIEKSWVVSAMMEDFPRLTDFDRGAGVILNSDELQNEMYRDHSEVRYRLRKGTSYELLNQKIAGFMKKHPEFRGNKPVTMKVYPYKDYRKLVGWETIGTSSLIFTAIGLMVLLAALFNYVLFAIGRMFNRQKELGIRQVNGAAAAAMLRMFMLEVSLILGITLVIAAAVIEMFSGYFDGERSYYLNFVGQGGWMSLMGGHLLEYTAIVWGIMLVIGYGIVRKVQRMTLLRNLQGGGIIYHSRLQTLLLGIQLIICMFLMGAVWFMQSQQQELEGRMAGRLTREEMENIYSFNLNGESLEPIRQDFGHMLTGNPYVEAWCRSGNSLLGPWMLYPKRYNLEGLEDDQKIVLQFNYVDPNYADFIHAQMKAGHFFTPNEPDAMVVNQAFVNWLGYNPVGKTMWVDYANSMTYRIVGVIEDILPVSDNPQIAPCIYLPYPDGYMNQTSYVKFRSGFPEQALQPLKAKMEAQVSGFTRLNITDIWSEMESYLIAVVELGNLILGLSIICLMISVLGIYSAMMLAVEKRSREMAIRKINGAALRDIALIFIGHYLKLLLLAACVAFPLLYWAMEQWLKGYDYRIALSWSVFVGVFVAMAGIVLLTILTQLLKIIRVNPTEALKEN